MEQKNLSEGELAQFALTTLTDLADNGNLDVIMYLCKKNINRTHYLQKLYKMITMETENKNENAIMQIAKVVYEITGQRIREAEGELLRQMNFDKHK